MNDTPDDARSIELAEDNPMYSEYLSRRADWKRTLADNREES